MGLGDSLCLSSSQDHLAWHKLQTLDPRWKYYQSGKELSLTTKEVKGQISVPRGPGMWGYLGVGPEPVLPFHGALGNKGPFLCRTGQEDPGSVVASISEGLSVRGLPSSNRGTHRVPWVSLHENGSRSWALWEA